VPRPPLKGFAARFAGGPLPILLLAASLAVTTGAAAYIGRSDPYVVVVLLIGLAVSAVLFVIARAALDTRKTDLAELDRTQKLLARHTERLRILHEIDRAVVEEKPPEAIAGAAIQPVRELLEVPRAIVNLFDLAAGEVEWLAAAGRRRTHVGPGVRYSMRMMGDVESLKRGEPQFIDTRRLPPGSEVDALLASGVEVYMVVPMIAGGELIGGLSFGGARSPFPPEQIHVAQEVATQFAIAISQARLYERVRNQAEELEQRVRERTRELSGAHAELQDKHTDLLRLASELKAANKELEAFSYSVSHDLRTPLRGISAYSQILLDEYRDMLDGDGQSYIDRIQAAVQRMSDLIDDMLQLSRVSRLELHRQQVNLSDLAREVLDELRTGETERTVRYEIQDNLEAHADKRLIRMALDNLLGNAWKFTSRNPAARIRFGAEQHDGAPAFFVTDNGAGFDMAYADKLFHPFQRLHRDSDFSGTGIGLATVQRIVARHGGRVWTQSAVDEGATFFFTLPPGSR
jgi:signal transduction histidine kinase